MSDNAKQKQAIACLDLTEIGINSRQSEQRAINISIQFGKYTVSFHDDDSLWLENEEGEGMQVWNNDVAELLDKFFHENF